MFPLFVRGGGPYEISIDFGLEVIEKQSATQAFRMMKPDINKK
jgi:hypothetical protein